MRWRGINHVELSVLDYDRSVAFYDRVFGWLGYTSFWTVDIGYRSTYYMARFPMPHSYIGLQPAKCGEPLVHEERRVGLHHLALWARSRREVDRFHAELLSALGVQVTEAPAEYPVYAPGYYAVFFDDPINGFHLELAHIPRLPGVGAMLRYRRAWKQAGREKGIENIAAKAMRKLPGRR